MFEILGSEAKNEALANSINTAVESSNQNSSIIYLEYPLPRNFGDRLYNINNSLRLGCYSMQSVRVSSFLNADFGRGNVQERKCSASKSAALFPARTERYVRAGLLLSGARPDVNREASKRK